MKALAQLRAGATCVFRNETLQDYAAGAAMLAFFAGVCLVSLALSGGQPWA